MLVVIGKGLLQQCQKTQKYRVSCLQSVCSTDSKRTLLSITCTVNSMVQRVTIYRMLIYAVYWPNSRTASHYSVFIGQYMQLIGRKQEVACFGRYSVV